MSTFSIPVCVREQFGLARVAEVIRFGVPLPRGLVHDRALIAVSDERGNHLLHQTRSLASWPDRSIKWLMIDCAVDVGAHERRALLVRAAGATRAAASLHLDEDADRFRIDSGVAQFELGRSAANPLLRVRIGEVEILREAGLRIELLGTDGRRRRQTIDRSYIEEAGPLRTTIATEGKLSLGGPGLPLAYRLRSVFTAGSAAVRLEFLVRNTQAAEHPGGLWDLGDAGSCFFEDLSIRLYPASPPRAVRWYAEDPRDALLHEGAFWTLYQDSSGGDRWNSRNHLNSAGELSVSFQGYEVHVARHSAAPVAKGRRATPSATLVGESAWVGATVGDFWQNFPKALRATDGTLEVSLFPGESRGAFELQGGEQKRHVVLLDFGLPQSEPSIPRLQHPVAVSVDASWIEESGAVPYFVPRAKDRNTQYLRYIDSIVEGPSSFVAKREIIDEYGWRNYGDLYADHEAVKHSGPHPLISHYNNQYDFIYAAAVHFLRSGDGRWRDLMEAAARHSIDIDIYHTDADRPAYNGGLFWHTDHYRDAATCTHRTYSRLNGASRHYGGGPSNEHNYTSGLLYYYYLTGDEQARESVLGLAEWTIAMDDGARTLLGLVDGGPTGLASKTVSESYHKAGRGAGNSINALLDAYALCGDRRYMRKAEELIQRCIHPADDIGALGLSEPERRWSYLVFLQVLGKYLDVKVELGEADYVFHYARESLLHYAKWILEQEVPYKDVLHKVEIPSETWPAHDVRKCHVLHLAAKYCAVPARERLRERATYFFNRCIQDVLSFDTAYATRPRVLLSTYGHVQSYFQTHGARLAEFADRLAASWSGHNYSFGQPIQFVPQRERWKAVLRQKTQIVCAECRRRLRDALHGMKVRLRPRPSE